MRQSEKQTEPFFSVKKEKERKASHLMRQPEKQMEPFFSVKRKEKTNQNKPHTHTQKASHLMRQSEKQTEPFFSVKKRKKEKQKASHLIRQSEKQTEPKAIKQEAGRGCETAIDGEDRGEDKSNRAKPQQLERVSEKTRHGPLTLGSLRRRSWRWCCCFACTCYMNQLSV